MLTSSITLKLPDRAPRLFLQAPRDLPRIVSIWPCTTIKIQVDGMVLQRWLISMASSTTLINVRVLLPVKSQVFLSAKSTLALVLDFLQDNRRTTQAVTSPIQERVFL